MTMTLISTVTVAVQATDIVFSSIPQTGTDIMLVISARNNNTSNEYQGGQIWFNGNFSGYSERRLRGTGSAVASDTASGGSLSYAIPNSNSTANTFGSTTVYIPNYTGSTAKSVSIDSVTENNAAGAFQTINADLWSGTAAITSVTVSTFTMAVGSTASLYTITKGSGGASVS